MFDIEPVFMPIGKEDKYELHVKDLEPYKLDALQISSPANPTGNIYSSENLKELIAYCDTKGIAFISDYLYGELSQIFEIDAAPDGAFYLWANVSKYTDDSFAFAKELLETLHVASTPGIDFGNNKTEQYLRFAYTHDIAHMSEGVRRLKKYLKIGLS